jgi:hypothetical protein
MWANGGIVVHRNPAKLPDSYAIEGSGRGGNVRADKGMRSHKWKIGLPYGPDCGHPESEGKEYGRNNLQSSRRLNAIFSLQLSNGFRIDVHPGLPGLLQPRFREVINQAHRL